MDTKNPENNVEPKGQFRLIHNGAEVARGTYAEMGQEVCKYPAGSVRFLPITPAAVATVAQVADAIEAPTDEHGLAIAPTSAHGVEVGNDGREVRSKFEHMPTLSSAAAAFREQIKAEERRTKPVRFRDLAMTPGMGVYNSSKGGPEKAVRLEPRAFSQLCARLGVANGRDYLLGMSPERRAENLTNDLKRGGQGVLRIRKNANGRPQVMAVVSERYTAHDGIEVLAAIERRAAPDSKGLILYSGTDWKICAFDPSARPSGWEGGRADAGANGVLFKGDDTGHGSIRGGGYAFRFVCSNGMVTGDGELDRKVHLGRARGMRDAVYQMVSEAYRDGVDFGEIYTKGLTLVPTEPLKELASVEKYLQSLSVVGKREELVPVLQDALAWEESNTGRLVPSLTNIANAITRAAHTTRTGDNVLELEQAATKYLRRGLLTAAR